MCMRKMVHQWDCWHATSEVSSAIVQSSMVGLLADVATGEAPMAWPRRRTERNISRKMVKAGFKFVSNTSREVR